MREHHGPSNRNRGDITGNTNFGDSRQENRPDEKEGAHKLNEECRSDRLAFRDKVGSQQEGGLL